MTPASNPIRMVERAAPSRPTRLGTHRRRPRQRTAHQAVGGTRPEAQPRPASLDTSNHLATTVANWLKSEQSESDVYAGQIRIHQRLAKTIRAIWDRHAVSGQQGEALKWEKAWLRLQQCQAEWIGYRAECCGSRSTPVAVPIGCNHRLCPLCAYHRSQKSRLKVKALFDRLTHPAMITLTVPNKDSIRKHDFTLMRERIRQLIAQRKDWIKGGVYSMETTYNRREKTYHLHAHILADLVAPLPAKTEKVELAGQRVYKFTAMKLRIEFDWLRLWGGAWGKKARKNADEKHFHSDKYTFENWVEIGRKMRLKEWRSGGWQPIEGLRPGEIKTRTAWNAENRRVIDIRPVKDRDGAAREVLKYITKVADFCDLPEAVEPFCNAVRGARLVQTFGSWYGVKLDDPAEADKPQDWGALKCACGCNDWRRMGVFYRRDVQMDESGRWRLKLPFDHNSAGTVPRPTIRALEARQE